MSERNTDRVVITGAFSYIGKYATRLLLGRGYKIRTLTNHVRRENPFGDQVQVFPFDFDHPDRLIQNPRGAPTLINTYWVRFIATGSDQAKAIYSGGIR
jgi:nucleoside-diphosphate-sugar epimerase